MSVQSKSRSWISWAIAFAVAFLVVGLVRFFWIESYRISTDAMNESLYRGDYVLVDKWLSSGNPGRNRVVLFTSPLLRDSMARPLFVSRCIGMPGDTIRVTGEGYEINGRQIPHSPRALKTYRVRPAIASPFLSALQKLDIPARDWRRDSVGFSLTLTGFEEYQVREELPDAMDSCFALQPMAPYTLVVPQKDRAYRLDAASLIACKEAIRTELGTKAVFREGKLFVDGKEITFFFFSQDHYWMLSDHADEAVDSRHLGFIPRDHVVGNVLFCWFSREKQRCLKPVY